MVLIVVFSSSRKEKNGLTVGGPLVPITSVGIRVDASATDVTVRNFVVSVGEVGIVVGDAEQILVEGNTITDGTCGTVPCHSSSNTIVGNDLSANGFRSLQLFNESTNNTIRSKPSYCNTLMGNAIYTLSTNNTVEENTIFSNLHDIGLLHDAPGNTIVNNESLENERCGLYFDSESDNFFEGNLARNNGRCDLAVLQSPPEEGSNPRDSTFSNNRLLNNRSYGVVIASELVTTNSMSNNELAGNGLEEFITPQESILSNFADYVGAAPAACSNP